MKNIEKYKKDLESLISDGDRLHCYIHLECYPEKYQSEIEKLTKEKTDLTKKTLPSFKDKYQSWYSESLALIKLLLPDRFDDFVRLYAKPKVRKEITAENYVVEDYLQGLSITRGWQKEKVVDPEAAIPRYQQQLNILKSVKKRFESSLFDIKNVLQADLFDSELEAAEEINKKGFTRGAGAMAGVVLERHLSQICESHNINISKKKPTINDFNQALKDSKVIEMHDWRFIQHLGDLRNLCDHDKKKEPTIEQVAELIAGVDKVLKTVF